jgi:flagellar motor switch protein FliN/FliY
MTTAEAATAGPDVAAHPAGSPRAEAAAAPAPGVGELAGVLRLQVPVIVRLGERSMTVLEVLAIVPGSIIELPKNAEAELDLLVNNKHIGTGVAVKVGENFGLRITYLGDLRQRIEAMAQKGE